MTLVAPQMPDLVERAEFAGPVAVVGAVVVAAHRPADFARQVEIRGQLARMEGVGPELVDHRVPSCVSGRA